MNGHSILVIADPATPQLAMLKELPEGASVTVGESPEDFERAVAEADVIFSWALGNGTFCAGCIRASRAWTIFYSPS